MKCQISVSKRLKIVMTDLKLHLAHRSCWFCLALRAFLSLKIVHLTLQEENPVNEKSKMSRILLSVVATENEICQNVTKRIKQHVPGMINYIIRVMKNPVFGISDQIRYKWCCTDIEDN